MNLYWPIYKRIEKEFLELTNYVHVSDDQLQVYSMHIGELIIRCAIEIEAISKELYERLGGEMKLVDETGKKRDIYFDTDCIKLLNEKWKLDKKQIMISTINVFLEKEENIILTPLKKAEKRGTSGSKWKQAYQAIKHSRYTALKQANVKNLINAMGALYILNLYFKDDRVDLGRVHKNDKKIENSAGSEIFSCFTFHATGLNMNTKMDDSCICSLKDEELDKSIFIIRYDEKSYREMYHNFYLDNEESVKNFENSTEIQSYLQEHPEDIGKSINEICMKVGGQELLLKIVCFKSTMKNSEISYELIINKHNSIYPLLEMEEHSCNQEM